MIAAGVAGRVPARAAARAAAHVSSKAPRTPTRQKRLQLLAGLRPLLPPQAASRAAAAGAGTSVPHRGERSSERSAQQVQAAEARVRAVLRRMRADPTATELSGAAWTPSMADGCPRLTGMGGVSLGLRGARHGNATRQIK